MSKKRVRIDNRVFRSHVSMAPLSVAAAVAAAIGAPSMVWAQTADAALEGLAAPNTEVVLVNKNTGSTRRTTSRADGTYSIVGLQPGTYTVTNGGNSKEVVLSVATIGHLDLVAAPEEVVITGKRLVETRTSEVSGIISNREIQTIPQITRNFLEFADSVAGVQFNVDGRGNTSLRGGTMEAGTVNVYIDGIGMKDFVSGGISGQAGADLNANEGDPGNPFPQSAIDQYKVITSNYKAEFDQLSSTAIVAQTKSGTNTFSGDAFANYTSDSLRAKIPAEVVAGEKKPGKTYEYGVSFGGPIITDKMHFFATLENKNLQLPNTVFPASSSGLTTSQAQALLPPDVASQFGPTSNPFKETLFFAKLDWEPSSNDRLELWDLHRHETSVSGAAGQTAASAASQVTNKNERVNLRWQHFADGWTNDLSLSYQDASNGSSPDSENPQRIYNYLNNGPQLLIQVGGIGPSGVHNESQKGVTFADSITWNDIEFAGRHTIKAGFKHSALTFGSQVQGQGVSYTYLVSPTGVDPTPYQASYSPLVGSFGNPALSYGDHQYGLFAQDDWQITPRLQANIGLRWDYDALDFWKNHITPSILTDALAADYPAAGGGTPGESYAEALAKGGINIGDYISNGSNRKPPANNFQPRLGLSFDLNGDQKHVIFGGWGRSYDINEFQKLAFESTKTANSVTATFNDPLYSGSCQPGDNGCLTWNDSYSTLAGIQTLSQNAFYSELDVVNNHIKMPYSDQFTIGMRNQLGGWNTSVALSEVDSYNRLVGWLGFRNAAGGYLANCGWGTSDGYAPAWCSNNFKPQGFPPGANANLVLWDNAARDKNTQVLISAEKPYTKESGWTVHFAYTYSNARVSDDYSYNTGNLYQFDFATPYAFPLLSSPVVARHRLVTTGSIDGPWGLIFSGKLTLATPIGATFSTSCGSVLQCNGGSTDPKDWNNWLVAGSGRPSGTLGERNLDLAVTENFQVSRLAKAYLRLDILNVTNTMIWDPGAESVTWNYPANPIVKYNKDGGPILGVPRTLKITAGFSW
ncbi:MAG TPA: TonB-dependent receptor [Steroidobacteraceae bacterium]|nr:TonB-dependent receptor [Steroidobacteraceae bacterium]